MTSIDAVTFKWLKSLRQLQLESNRIISFDRNALVGLNNLEKVCLAENIIASLFPEILNDICTTNPKCKVLTMQKCLL